jgi:outer membrane protein assembly factor BamD (BamD/ComL family)
MDLFRQAQGALGSNPSLALALCARHEKQFPRSAFGQERDVLMIDALIRTGRRSEAEARANRFRAAYPRSAHVRRIDSMLGR